MERGTIVAGRYEIETLAGIGGMGTVFRARDSDGRPVAIKVLHPHGDQFQLDARFAREIALLHKLRHPHIVRYLHSGLTRTGEQFLVMEWLEGEVLESRLRNGRMCIVDALVLAERIASALGFAHEHGVVHRDVKPHNIFLPGGDVNAAKLLDFGVARWAHATLALTRPGTAFGTPAYMSPEQVRGDPRIDARADVFSLGCVLFECITGQPAFSAPNPMAALGKILFDEAQRAGGAAVDIPASITALLQRMLAKTPDDRPHHGAAVVREIARLRAMTPGEILHAPAPARAAEETITETELRLVSVMAARLAVQPSDVGTALPPPEARLEVAWPGCGSSSTAARGSRPPLSSPGARAPTRIALLPGAPGVAAPPFPDTVPGERTSVATRSPLAAHAESLRIQFEAMGARLGVLRDGSLIALLDNRTTSTSRTAVDQAVAATRCALALCRAFPHATVAIATGRAEVWEQRLVGEAIERATAMLGMQPLPATPAGNRAAIRIDALTAQLVQRRFVVQPAIQEEIYLVHGEPAGLRPRRLQGGPTPFVGRKQELSMLVSAFESCVDEDMARVVMVSGDPGMGKSRLCAELLRHLEEHGQDVEIWSAQGDPMHGGSPLSLLAEAIRSAVGILGSEPVAERRSKLRAYVADRVAGAWDVDRLVTFLGELLGVAPAEPEAHDLQLRAARMDFQRMGDQVRRACCDLLDAVTLRGPAPEATGHGRTDTDLAEHAERRKRPLLLVLDDLQWGDRATVEVLDLALRTLAERPILVLALGRPEIHDLFPGIWSQHDVIELKLGRMSRRAAAQLVRAGLGPDIGLERTAALIEHAEGNPFYLEELVRGAAAGGVELPQTVRAMVHAQLSDLDPHARRVLRAASVFGQTFWQGGVTTLVGAGTLAGAYLDALVRDELIVPRNASRFPGEPEYRFAHPLIQEGAYAMLTARDRQLGHRLAGTWLERSGEADAQVLAGHFDRGAAPEQALPFYVRAAEAALDRSDFDAAVALAARGEACGATGAMLGALRRVQAEEQIWRGTPAAVARLCEEAVALLPRGCRAWYDMLGELALARGKLYQRDRLEALADALGSGAGSSEDAAARAGRRIAATRLAQQLFIAGSSERAAALLAAVEAEVGDLERADPIVAADIHLGRAVRASALFGDSGEVLEELARCAVCFEEIGDLRQACLHRTNVGYAKLELGLHEEAESDLRVALATAERIGLDYVASGVRVHLAEVHARRGTLDQAEALAQQARTWFVTHEDTRMEILSRLRLAAILLRAGKLDGAEHEACAALDRLSGSAPLRPRALATLARIHLQRGDTRRALATATTAMHLLESLGAVESGEALVRLTHAEALHGSHDHERARVAIAHARDRLLAQAGKIGRADWQASFLDHIPAHARILRLARRWTQSAA